MSDVIKFKLIIISIILILIISNIGNVFSENQNVILVKSSNQVYFNVNDIMDASSRVKIYIETNHRLPNYVQISGKQVNMPDFLRIIAICTSEINNNQKYPISLKNIRSPSSPSENLKVGKIYRSEYFDMAQRIKVYSDSNNIAPNYVSSSLGNIRFENAVYIYCKILNFYKVNNVFPNYVSVNKWNVDPVDPDLVMFLKPSVIVNLIIM